MGPSTTLESTVESRTERPNAHVKALPRRRSRKKRFLFSLLAAVGIGLIAELLALVAYGLVEGRPFSYARAQQERDDVRNPAVLVNDGSAEPEFLRSKSLHPYVGYVATPNPDASKTSASGDVRPPHFGYYDANPIRTRSADKVIVAILGGSVAYGFGVPGSDGKPSGSDMLEQRLLESPRFAGKEIVFLRLALSGYKQPQQLMTLSYLLSLGAEFDVVINIDGFNEVALHPAENAQTDTFAAYPRMWSFQTASHHQQGTGRYLSLSDRRVELSEFHSRSALRYSIAANLVWKLRDRTLARQIYETQQSMLADKSTAPSYESTGPARRYADEQAMMNDLVAIWKRSSLQLDRLCQGNGIAYYHVLQPNQYVPGSKRLTPTEQAEAYDPHQPYKRGAEIGYPLLIQAGRELKQDGVQFTDLSRAFADVDETLYIDNCCHFNAEGYNILADQIASAILASPAH